MYKADDFAQIIIDALEQEPRQGAIFLCGLDHVGAYGCDVALRFATKGGHAWIWVLTDPSLIAAEAFDVLGECVAADIPIRYLHGEKPPMPFGCGAVVDLLHAQSMDSPYDEWYHHTIDWLDSLGLHHFNVNLTDTSRKYSSRYLQGIKTAQEKTLQESKEDLLYTTLRGCFTLCRVLKEEDIRLLLPPRPIDTHKGECGHALIVAGSLGMAGAAALCVNAALRGGAGLVTAVCPPEIIPILQVLAPCAMCIAPEHLEQAIASKNAIAVGPGLGKSESLHPLLETLLEVPAAQVWDADALNWLSEHPRKLTGNIILTPHIGEAARLLQWNIRRVMADPEKAAVQLQKQYNAVVLLKGPITLITDGMFIACNLTGTPGMATGGCGDVLTGLIAAFLAQGLVPFEAAQLAAYLHGIAGEKAAKARGIRSMTAQDILDFLRIE